MQTAAKRLVKAKAGVGSPMRADGHGHREKASSSIHHPEDDLDARFSASDAVSASAVKRKPDGASAGETRAKKPAVSAPEHTKGGSELSLGAGAKPLSRSSHATVVHSEKEHKEEGEDDANNENGKVAVRSSPAAAASSGTLALVPSTRTGKLVAIPPPITIAFNPNLKLQILMHKLGLWNPPLEDEAGNSYFSYTSKTAKNSMVYRTLKYSGPLKQSAPFLPGFDSKCMSFTLCTPFARMQTGDRFDHQLPPKGTLQAEFRKAKDEEPCVIFRLIGSSYLPKKEKNDDFCQFAGDYLNRVQTLAIRECEKNLNSIHQKSADIKGGIGARYFESAELGSDGLPMFKYTREMVRTAKQEELDLLEHDADRLQTVYKDSEMKDYLLRQYSIYKTMKASNPKARAFWENPIPMFRLPTSEEQRANPTPIVRLDDDEVLRALVPTALLAVVFTFRILPSAEGRISLRRYPLAIIYGGDANRFGGYSVIRGNTETELQQLECLEKLEREMEAQCAENAPLKMIEQKAASIEEENVPEEY
jgi:hypothetical protein